MTILTCSETSCIYNDERFYCTAEHVNLEMDSYNICGAFEHYSDSEEYSHKYYKRILDRETKEQQKDEAKGKKIEFEGLVLYTEDDMIHDKDCWCTEEITGIVAPMSELKNSERLAMFKEEIKKLVPVIELPDYVKEEK